MFNYLFDATLAQMVPSKTDTTIAIQQAKLFFPTITGRNILPTQSLLQGQSIHTYYFFFYMHIKQVWGKHEYKQESVLDNYHIIQADLLTRTLNSS